MSKISTLKSLLTYEITHNMEWHGFRSTFPRRKLMRLNDMIKIAILGLGLTAISCKPKKDDKKDDSPAVTSNNRSPAPVDETKNPDVPPQVPKLGDLGNDQQQPEKEIAQEDKDEGGGNSNLRGLDNGSSEREFEILDNLEKIELTYSKVLFIDSNKKLIAKEIDLNSIYRSESADKIVLLIDDQNIVYNFDTRMIKEFEGEIQRAMKPVEANELFKKFVAERLIEDREFQMEVVYEVEGGSPVKDISYALTYDESLNMALTSEEKFHVEFYIAENNGATDKVVALSIKGKDDDKFGIRKTEQDDIFMQKKALALLTIGKKDIFLKHYEYLVGENLSEAVELIDEVLRVNHNEIHTEIHGPSIP